MAVLVRIPSQLQTLTGGEREVKVSGSTVAEVIEVLNTSFPGIKERLLDEEGEIRRFINIYVDEEDVRFQDGLLTKVEEGSEISIIPAVAGGSFLHYIQDKPERSGGIEKLQEIVDRIETCVIFLNRCTLSR